RRGSDQAAGWKERSRGSDPAAGDRGGWRRTGDGTVAGEATERRMQLHQWRSSSAPRAAGPNGEEGTGGVLATVVPQQSERKRFRGAHEMANSAEGAV
ncbi:hypothetical protein GW17_00017760, partial [Ensete ventricosum]